MRRSTSEDTIEESVESGSVRSSSSSEQSPSPTKPTSRKSSFINPFGKKPKPEGSSGGEMKETLSSSLKKKLKVVSPGPTKKAREGDGSEKRNKSKGKTSSLVKKIGAIAKSKKKIPVVDPPDDAVSPESMESTPTSSKRHTPEGADLGNRSSSELSLGDESAEPIASDGCPTTPDVSAAEDKPRAETKIADLRSDFLSDVYSPEPVVTGAGHSSTLPFAMSSWTPTEIRRPIESPSPQDALRRRIAWVAQPTCVSEEKEDSAEPATKTDKPNKPQPQRGTPEKKVPEVTHARKLTISKAREASTLPGIEEDRTESSEQAEDSEDVGLQPESAMPAFGDVIVENEEDHAPMSNLSNSMDRREHLYKILVIGELGTGKTSIIKRYVHQFFSQHYRATIGVDFALKVLNWDSNTIIRLQLWDIAGQERFGNMTRVYYKEAVGAFIVFDVTRVATFDAVVKWKADLDSKVQLPDGTSIPCVLLANKCDQQKEGIVNTPSKMDDYCKEKGFTGWFETSAKENINIEEAARTLVNKILQNDKLVQTQDSIDSEKFAVDGRSNGKHDTSGSSRSCSC